MFFSKINYVFVCETKKKHKAYCVWVANVFEVLLLLYYEIFIKDV